MAVRRQLKIDLQELASTSVCSTFFAPLPVTMKTTCHSLAPRGCIGERSKGNLTTKAQNPFHLDFIACRIILWKHHQRSHAQKTVSSHLVRITTISTIVLSSSSELCVQRSFSIATTPRASFLQCSFMLSSFRTWLSSWQPSKSLPVLNTKW